MATITLNEWNKYRLALTRVNKEAGNEFRDYFLKRNGTLEGVTVQEVIDYAYALATKYGEASAEVACQLYEAIAEIEGVRVPDVMPADTPTYGDVAKAINGTLKNTQNTDYLSSVVEQLVKQVGQDTIVNNALRDGAQFAWIPMSDTCAFCLALAANGWQYASEAEVKNGHAEHIHGNCDCTYAIRFNEQTNYEGYNPKIYSRFYNAADGKTAKDKINSMRRQLYAENKEEINKQKREAYALRKGIEAED